MKRNTPVLVFGRKKSRHLKWIINLSIGLVLMLAVAFETHANVEKEECDLLLVKLESSYWGVSFYGKEEGQALSVFNGCAEKDENFVAPEDKEFYSMKILLLSGRLEQTFEKLKSMAKDGHDKSQKLLGDVYSNKEFEKYYDIHQARYWYRKAMNQGNIRAKVSLSNSYIMQGEDERKRDEGFGYLIEAASSGDVTAQILLGHHLYSGEKVERNVDESIYWFSKVSEKGSIDGLAALFSIFVFENDYEKEKRDYVEMVINKSNENPSFMFMLSIFYDVGFGVKKDRELGEYYAEQSRKQFKGDDIFIVKDAIKRSGLRYAILEYTRN